MELIGLELCNGEFYNDHYTFPAGIMQRQKMSMPERIYNSHYGNGVPAMFTS